MAESRRRSSNSISHSSRAEGVMKAINRAAKQPRHTNQEARLRRRQDAFSRKTNCSSCLFDRGSNASCSKSAFSPLADENPSNRHILLFAAAYKRDPLHPQVRCTGGPFAFLSIHADTGTGFSFACNRQRLFSAEGSPDRDACGAVTNNRAPPPLPRFKVVTDELLWHVNPVKRRCSHRGY